MTGCGSLSSVLAGCARWAVAACCLLPPAAVLAADKPAITPTTLRYGVLADFPPYQIWPEGGLPGGADLDLLHALAQQHGHAIQPLRYTDASRLEADLRAGLIDVASSMTRNPARDAALYFSPAYTRMQQALLTRADAPIGALAPDLGDRSIAVVGGGSGQDHVDRLFPLAPRVVVGGVAEAIEAVAAGRADATLQPLPVLVDLIERRRLGGLQVARRFELPGGALHFAFTAGRRDTGLALSALLAGSDPAQFDATLQRWSARPNLLRAGGLLEPDAQQRAALQRLGPLRVALLADERPFAFRPPDAAQPVGIDVDMLTLTLARLGLPAPTWQRLDAAELPAALQRGEIDLVLGLGESAAWATALRFIGPILEYPMVLIGKREGGVYDLGQLGGLRLALPTAHFGRALVESRHASIEIVDCAQLADCVEAVARGQAEATMADVVAAAIALAEKPRADVQIIGAVEALTRTRSIGIAARHAALVPLFRNALDGAVADELQTVKARWLGRPPPAEVVKRVLRQAAPWVAGSLALLFAAWWWHSSALRREVKRTRAAQQLAERARGASERFVTFLAHEVRNSLHSVIAGAELLRSARQVTPTIAASLGESARSTLNLLNNLLDRDRLEAGRLSLHLEPARLDPLLRSVAVEMLPAALAKQLVLQARPLASDPLLRIDALRVQQVLRNLVANAIKYSHAGEITIEARCETLPDDPARRAIELRVSDQGPGIAPADQGRLFERYFTVAGPDGAEQPAGTGLGLALCRDLARLMGGDLLIESEPGRGTTAVLLWQAEIEPAVEAAAAPAAPLRFLLVEDAEVYGMLLERALAAEGLPVAVAGSLTRARELLAQRAFDVLLTDLHLGDGDAHAVIAAARDAGGDRPPTLVVMSAEVDENGARALRDAGAQAVLKKTGDVALFVRQLLQHPALQRA